MKGMLLRNGLVHLLVLLFISVSGIAQVATWNVSTLPGGAGNFGPNPQPPTTTDANATVTGLTRAVVCSQLIQVLHVDGEDMDGQQPLLRVLPGISL
jgi:hypothetical protein